MSQSDHEHGAAGILPIADPFLTAAQAAARLNYSLSHFRALARAGKVPRPIQPGGPGGKLLWRQSRLDKYLRTLEADTASAAV
jgi:hypothetical protein